MTPQSIPPQRPGLLAMGWRGLVWLWIKAWSVLWNDKVPLLINIILIAATAYTTYYIAPKINGTFERQKIQSAYVLENLRSINSHISEIYVDVGEINYSIASGKQIPTESISNARETISRLNWKVIETAAVLKHKEDVSKLEEFQISLDNLRISLDKTKDIETAMTLSENMKKMSVIGVDVIESIGSRASLDPSKSPLEGSRPNTKPPTPVPS